MTALTPRSRDRPLVLGAPVGTELQRRGFELRAPSWSAAAIREAPGLLTEIHGDYARAGADVVVADTTCARPSELGDDAESQWREALALARTAGVAVVAAIAMLPRQLAVDVRVQTYATLATWSDDADGILLEGFVDVDELGRALAATASARRPRWAALAGPGSAKLGEAVARLDGEVDLWAVHCCSLAEASAALGGVDRTSLGGARLGAWPNPPDPRQAGLEAFTRGLFALARTHELAVVGACCGGTPDTVATLRAGWP